MSNRIAKTIVTLVLVLFSCVVFSQGGTSPSANAQGTYKKAKKQDEKGDQDQQEIKKKEGPKKAKKQEKS